MTDENKHTIRADSGGGREVSLDVDLPGNSKTPKKVTVSDLSSAKVTVPEKPVERPKLEQVVQNAANRKKRGFGAWFRDTFTGEDAKAVARHVGMDVIIPAIKDMVADAGTQALHRMLFGEGAPPRGSRDRGGARTTERIPYGRMSTSGGRRELAPRSRANHHFEDIILDSRQEAEDTLYSLRDRIHQYGSATVSDLYDLVGISGDFTDDKWGWYDLRDSGIRRNRAGFLLVLPRPEVIE